MPVDAKATRPLPDWRIRGRRDFGYPSWHGHPARGLFSGRRTWANAHATWETPAPTRFLVGKPVHGARLDARVAQNGHRRAKLPGHSSSTSGRHTCLLRRQPTPGSARANRQDTPGRASLRKDNMPRLIVHCVPYAASVRESVPVTHTCNPLRPSRRIWARAAEEEHVGIERRSDARSPDCDASSNRGQQATA